MKSFEEFKRLKNENWEEDERAGAYYAGPDQESDGDEFQNLDRPNAGAEETWLQNHGQTQKVTSLMDYIGDSLDPEEIKALIHLLQQHSDYQGTFNAGQHQFAPVTTTDLR